MYLASNKNYKALEKSRISNLKMRRNYQNQPYLRPKAGTDREFRITTKNMLKALIEKLDDMQEQMSNFL